MEHLQQLLGQSVLAIQMAVAKDKDDDGWPPPSSFSERRRESSSSPSSSLFAACTKEVACTWPFQESHTSVLTALLRRHGKDLFVRAMMMPQWQNIDRNLEDTNTQKQDRGRFVRRITRVAFVHRASSLSSSSPHHSPHPYSGDVHNNAMELL